MVALLLLCVLFAFVLQEWVYRKGWDKNLSVRVSFVDAYAYEGDTSYLREEIANDKLLPLPALEVRLAISRNLAFAKEAKANSNVTDQSYKRDVFSFLFHQKVIHTLPFLCKRRGFYRISTAEAVGCDLFFSARYCRDEPQQTQFYVYPRQVDARRIRLVCQTVTGMARAKSRLYPDPYEFAGIREYRQDAMRQINWKASAKSGKWMVNQYDSTTNICVTLVLDVEDANILRSDLLTEEAIRIASSLAARIEKEEMEMRLASNAVYDSHAGEDMQKEALFWHAKPGAGHLRELNRKLACIDLVQPARPLLELLEKEAQARRTGQIYVLISKNQDASILERLRALAAGGEVLWVVPVMPGADISLRGTQGVRMMRWEVGQP